jgi:hypothetical protein
MLACNFTGSGSNAVLNPSLISKPRRMINKMRTILI